MRDSGRIPLAHSRPTTTRRTTITTSPIWPRWILKLRSFWRELTCYLARSCEETIPPFCGRRLPPALQGCPLHRRLCLRHPSLPTYWQWPILHWPHPCWQTRSWPPRRCQCCVCPYRPSLFPTSLRMAHFQTALVPPPVLSAALRSTGCRACSPTTYGRSGRVPARQEGVNLPCHTAVEGAV